LLALPEHKILETRFFDGLSDTLRVLADSAKEAVPAKLTQLQEDLASASRPGTLSETWQRLNRLATSATTVLDALDAENSESQAKWWARAFVQQCRRVLEDLAFLAPWILLPSSPEKLKSIGGMEGIPTLRELAMLSAKLPSAIDAIPGDLRQLIADASRRAGERIAAIDGLAMQSGEFAKIEYDFLFDKASHLLTIGYNVTDHRRDSSYLRPAGFGGEIVLFCRNSAGTVAAGKLVCPGTTARCPRWASGSSFVERFNVRVPYAAPDHADVRPYAA